MRAVAIKEGFLLMWGEVLLMCLKKKKMDEFRLAELSFPACS